MKTTALLCLAVLLGAVAAQGNPTQETALLVTVSFLPNGSATLDNIEVTFDGIDGEQRILPQADTIKLVNNGTTYYESWVPVTFKLLDAPAPLSRMTITRRLPYFGNVGELRIERRNKTVATFDLNKLCNNDGWCRGFENGLSCPADCSVVVPDYVCTPYTDRACDPDCAPQLDTDCKPTAKVPPAATALYLLLGLAAVALLYYAAYAYYRRQ